MKKALVFSLLLFCQFMGLSHQDLNIRISKVPLFNANSYTSSSFAPFFKEFYESLLVILKDGMVVFFTEQRVDCIQSLSTHCLINVIEYFGYRIDDVAIIVHNHNLPKPISKRDKKFCRSLGKYGFKGKFLVFYPVSGLVKEYKYLKRKIE